MFKNIKKTAALITLCLLALTSMGAKETEKPTDITAEDIVNLAKIIVADIHSELNWKEIPLVMEAAAHLITESVDLPPETQKFAIIQLVDQVIDLCNTPLIPNLLAHPLYKILVPLFVDVFTPDPELANIDFSGAHGATSEADCVIVAKVILSKFETPFQWSDLAFAFKAAIQFSGEIENLTSIGRAQCINNILDAVVDLIDFPHMPDIIVHPIVKMFVSALVNQVEKYLQ